MNPDSDVLCVLAMPKFATELFPNSRSLSGGWRA